MSSMLKKKGGFAFKPKAPQLRRAPTATPSSQGPQRSATAETTQNAAASSAPRATPAKSTVPDETTAVTVDEPFQAQSAAQAAPAITDTSKTSSISGSRRTAASSVIAPASGEETTGNAKTPVPSSAKASTSAPLPPLGSRAPAPHDEPQSLPSTTGTTNVAGPAPKRQAPTQGGDHEDDGAGDDLPDINTVLAAQPPASDASRPKKKQKQSGKQTGTHEADEVTAAANQADVEAEAAAPRGSKAAGRKGAAKKSTTTRINRYGDIEEVEDEPEEAAPKPKRPTRKRSVAATAAAEYGDEYGDEVEEDDEAPPPKKRKYTRKKKASSEDQAEGGEQGDGAPTKPKRKPRRRKKAAADADGAEQDGEDVEADGDGARKKKTHKERSVTPEDAETQVVDPSKLTMAELTKDLRIGKKFSRHDELRDRQRKAASESRAVLKKKRAAQKAKEGGDMDGDAEDDGSDANAEPNPEADAQAPAPNPAPQERAAPTNAGAVQYEILNGELVIKQSSLFHDRHAAAAAEAGDLEEVEENDFSQHITSATYRRRPGRLRGANTWDEHDTERFYHYLEMFGTDFDMIAGMFPGRSRRHVKLKFNREERVDPDRVTRVMIGEKRIAIDVDEVARVTGHEYEATEVIKAAHRAREEKHEEEQRQVEEEAAQRLRVEREALLGKPDAPGDGAAAVANGAGAAKRDRAPAQQRTAAANAGPRTVLVNGELVEEVDETDEVAQTTSGRGRGRGRGRGGRGGRGRGGPVMLGASGFGV